MKNESKVMVFALSLTVIALALSFTVHFEHTKYWYQFPGFETFYGIVSVVAFALIIRTLRIIQKEGFEDD